MSGGKLTLKAIVLCNNDNVNKWYLVVVKSFFTKQTVFND